MSNILILLKKIFFRINILPILLLLSIIIFTFLSENFLTFRNITNVLRQSSYLAIVSMGQMLALLTGGFDLSVGTIVAVTSVTGAATMASLFLIMPDSVAMVIFLGCLVGVLAGTMVGVVNGIGVSVLNVSPFIMTLGITSVGFGIALFLTGGVPVYGMPVEFSGIFGFGSLWGIPTPLYAVGILFILLYIFLNYVPTGRYFYAVGGNVKASILSGINAKRILFIAYVLCGFLSAIAGLLITARLDTGEATIGGSLPLQSIAACIIAGISLRGGIGSVGNVVLGALFIGLVQNGMNLARIESYLQIVVLGLLLILAVVLDNVKQRFRTRIEQ